MEIIWLSAMAQIARGVAADLWFDENGDVRDEPVEALACEVLVLATAYWDYSGLMIIDVHHVLT